MELRLVDRARQLLKEFSVPNDDPLSKFTFRSVNGQSINFYNDHRPATRCLAYHARQAYQHAKRKGWVQKDTLAFREFGSPGYPKVLTSTIIDWLTGV